MKLYVLIILIILITACASKTDISKESAPEPIASPPEIQAETASEQPIPEQKPLPAEKLVEEKTENIIEIKEDSFYPGEKKIVKNTEIKWVNKDEKRRIIACYLEGKKVTTSPNLLEGGSFTYVFPEEGKYTCIDSIFGLRSTVEVGSAKPSLSPTGGVIRTGLDASSLTAISIIMGIILLFIFSRRKR